MGGNLYLGIDASTQSMSAIVIDCANPKNAFSLSVNFGENFPAYNTTSGVVVNPEDKTEVWSYPLMWAEALDMLMLRLSENIDMSRIAGIGGAGQQHASVWLNSAEAFSGLANAPKGGLAAAIKPFLATERAPIWMDTSTSRECAEIEAAVGADNVLQKTGSVQTERFTGAQIRKMSKRSPQVYANTKRVHLNSSFVCSLLCNSDCPVDYGDASGMNLLNMRTLDWDADMLAATADNLLEKLPKLSKSMECAGSIGAYFARNYGIPASAKVFVFSGDNPSSLVGCGASGGGSAVVSLGTSDTFFCANSVCSPVAGAHVFGNPAGGFMNLACFRNGSLAREALKDRLGISWQFFDSSFGGYLPRVDGGLVLPYFFDEISPKISSSDVKYVGGDVSSLAPVDFVRLFLEGQFMNMRLQADELKASVSDILLVGGASKSAAIAQCIANVFGSCAYVSKKSENSSALGGALTAASKVEGLGLKELAAMFNERVLVASPQKEAVEVYKNKIARFALERGKLIK